VKSTLEKSIEWNEYNVATQDAPLKPHVALRWSNRVRGQGSMYGLTVIWADAVRPCAIASIYPWAGELAQDYDSLTREPNLVAKQNGQAVWRPEKAGLEFRAVPDAPPPAESATRRRLQLKELAGRFSLTMVGWNADDSDREELRLLPQWLYRYGEEGRDVLDGALFAYVLGTDPEAALLLEAYRANDDQAYQWQFAFVRQTSGGLEARLGDEVVWSAQKRPFEDDPSQPHFRLRRPLLEEMELD
jgi:hypothetical protein